MSAWSVESAAFAVSADEATCHHNTVTGVQELVGLEADDTGTTPVLREWRPHVVHDALRTAPGAAVRHTSAVLDPLDIGSQDLAGSFEVATTERPVGVLKRGHIRLRHRITPLARRPSCPRRRPGTRV